MKMTNFNIGDKVRVVENDWTATVKRILNDGDLLLDDGENDGVYSPNEVELVAKD